MLRYSILTNCRLLSQEEGQSFGHYLYRTDVCDIGARLSLYLSFVSCSYSFKADVRKDIIVIVRQI